MAQQDVPSSGDPVDWSSVELKPNDDPSNSITLGYTVKLADPLIGIPDFSAPGVNPGDVAVFLHELNHVWEYTQWGFVEYYARAATERTYTYSISPATSFGSLGMEQESAVVEDYYRVSNGLPARWAITPTPLSTYQSVLSPYGVH